MRQSHCISAETCAHTVGVNDERAPICPRCGVTMVPADLSARDSPDGDWICLECEENAEPE
jgi:hypothetical protein